MVFSAIFQLFRGGKLLLMEETGIRQENHRPSQVIHKLSHTIFYRVHLMT